MIPNVKWLADIPPVKPTPLPRQRNLSQISHSYFKPNLRCPVKMWVSESSDNEVSVSACQDLSNRQRTFYTSLGNKMLLKIQMELSAKDEVMSFYVSRPNEVLPWQNKLLHFKGEPLLKWKFAIKEWNKIFIFMEVVSTPSSRPMGKLCANCWKTVSLSLVDLFSLPFYFLPSRQFSNLLLLAIFFQFVLETPI